MGDGFDMADAMLGVMFYSQLSPLTESHGSSRGSGYAGSSGEIASLRREIALLRRDLNVAFAILVQHGLAEMPAQKEQQGEA